MPAQARTYVVAPTPAGNDTLAGTLAQPWASIQKAADSARAGDTVCLHGGTYTLTQEVHPARSGAPGAWIVYTALPGETPLIDAIGHVTVGGSGERGDDGVFQLNHLAYIRMQGLTIVNSHNAGICVRSGDSIEVLNCTTHKTAASGICMWGAHSIPQFTVPSTNCRVIGNTIVEAHSREMEIVPSGGTPVSELPHEAISIAGVRGFEVAHNEVRDGDKEGIDVKEDSRDGTVHHNFVHRMARQGLYIDAWFDTLRNVTMHDNLVIDCMVGMAVSSENGPPVENIVVHHNVFFENRGSGMFISAWGSADGLRRAVEISNNTFHRNGWRRTTAFPHGGIYIETHNIRDCFIRNNLFTENHRMNIAYADGLDFAAQHVVVEYNLVDRHVDSTSVTTGISAYVGDSTIVGDAAYAGAADTNFRLTALSDAIDAGHPDARYEDPDGTRNDIGAYWFEQTAVAVGPAPSALASLKGWGLQIVLGRNGSTLTPERRYHAAAHGTAVWYGVDGRRTTPNSAHAARVTVQARNGCSTLRYGILLGNR